ncbi:S41 family peptidase [Nannocystis pusilla]|nr:S41 family peptidase [Nannocystis pusilla]
MIPMPCWRSFLAFSLGAAVMWCIKAGPPEAQAGNNLGTDAYGKALRTVIDRYVDPVEPSRVLAESLKRIVSGLDRHSHYLTADERALLKQRSRGGSTGMVVELQRAEPGTRKPARLEVVAVLPGSPAEKIGLQPGDSILKIRDQDVAFMLSRAEVDVLLLGGDGETIELTVQRRNDAAPTAQRLVLSGQALPVVSGALVEHAGRKFAHVRIRAFRSGVADSVRSTLKELRRSAGAAGLGGVVLDVRGNPGGDVGEAVLIADTFVGEGVLVRTRGRGGQILREERATQAATDDATKVVVLQDHRSASASELLAVALQDHGRAKVVGERSYGKGTVQDVIGLDDGSVLTLTIARYFSPKDRLIDGAGVEPDVVVPDMTTQPEAALRAALAAL